MLQHGDGTRAYTVVLTETNSYVSNIALCLYFLGCPMLDILFQLQTMFPS